MKMILGSAALLLILSGCASNVTYVEDSKSMVSAGLDYHDIEGAAKKSVENLLSSGYVQMLDKKKVVAISDVINDTMQKINIQELTMSITRDMRNSGKFQLTNALAGSGGMKDSMFSTSRELRDNEEFNQKTTIEKGQALAPDLSLSGKIVQRNTSVGNKQRIDYSFLLVLTNLKTGIVEWDDSVHIIKATSKKNVAY